jgi:hypothetical protein
MQQSTGDLRSFISLPVLIGHIDYRYAACLTSGFDCARMKALSHSPLQLRKIVD